jgi:hypothetical protein
VRALSPAEAAAGAAAVPAFAGAGAV